jgi:hypothetical protein
LLIRRSGKWRCDDEHGSFYSDETLQIRLLEQAGFKPKRAATARDAVKASHAAILGFWARYGRTPSVLLAELAGWQD